MRTATTVPLVPEVAVPRALALLNGGSALATTIAAPLGSYLGQFIGWHGAFFCVVPLAAVTFAWLSLIVSRLGERGDGSAQSCFQKNDWSAVMRTRQSFGR